MRSISERSQLVEAAGPWPFTSRQTFLLSDSSHVEWQSRHHRKDLENSELQHVRHLISRLSRTLWVPWELNWWIGLIFSLGALLFVTGSILVLAPNLLALSGEWANQVYFLGSIPFTTAAYLQLYQAANAGDFDPLVSRRTRSRIWFGWFPHKIGWLSCLLQFLGTLLFNANAFDALLPGLNWWQQDLQIWTPNFLGSILFLASGQLAFAETCHAHFAWQPKSLSWWVTFANLFGCVAFMISAFLAFVPPQPFSFDAVTISVFFTLLGGVGFLVGSLLMLSETARAEG